MFIYAVLPVSWQASVGMFSFIITVLGLGVSCLVLDCNHFTDHL